MADQRPSRQVDVGCPMSGQQRPYRPLRRLARWWVGPSKDDMMREVIEADRRREAEVRAFLQPAPSDQERPS